MGIFKRFKQALNQEAYKVFSEGGMKQKYNVVVDHFCNTSFGCVIVDEGPTSIHLTRFSFGDPMTVKLVQTFGTVTIIWDWDHCAWGHKKKKWVFDEYMDQNIIVQTMLLDMNHLMGGKLLTKEPPLF